MKTLISIFAFFFATMFVANAQCPNATVDTNITIATDAQLGRSINNDFNIARVCKGSQSKFWIPLGVGSLVSLNSWVVTDSNDDTLLISTNDTLILQNLVATEGPLKIKAYLAGISPFLQGCWVHHMKFEVLETSNSISYTNLNGTFVVSNIPNHYSVNIRSIPNGADYSNGYLYDNGSLIFQLPNGSYQLIFTAQNHVWMNMPTCMDPLLFDTIVITNSNVAVSYIEDDASITIFPNPASDHFVVKADAEIQSITLLNSIGQEILKQDYIISQQISVADLPVGTYVIIIETTDKQLVRKQLVKY